MNNGFNRVLRGYGFKARRRQSPSVLLRSNSPYSTLWNEYLFEQSVDLISFQSASTAVYQASSSSASWSHSCTGQNRLLIVGVAIRGLDNVPSVSSITYGGTPLTKIIHLADQANGTLRTELWYLIAPQTGTNTINVTLSAAAFTNLGCGATNYINVRQTQPIGNVATSNSLIASSVVTPITTTSNNSMLVDFIHHRNDIDIDPNIGQIHNLEFNNGSNTIFGFSNKLRSNIGTDSLGWSQGASSEWNHIVTEIRTIGSNLPGTTTRRIFSGG